MGLYVFKAVIQIEFIQNSFTCFYCYDLRTDGTIILTNVLQKPATRLYIHILLPLKFTLGLLVNGKESLEKVKEAKRVRHHSLLLVNLLMYHRVILLVKYLQY